MSIFEKKEKNLNELINKLDVLTSTYSQSSYEKEKIITEKNEILKQKSIIENRNRELMREHQYLKQKIIKLQEEINKKSFSYFYCIINSFLTFYLNKSRYYRYY